MSKYDIEKDHPQTIKSEPDARPPEMEREEGAEEQIDEAEQATERLESRLSEEEVEAIRRQTHSAHTIGSAIGGSRD
ncbi:V-type ATPase 116kDa subunit family protein [Sphingomonas piscis]|uniref:V-type ATPase 116kDa subunit family protein n=1 Tax=Sphingomonas piscis TaxID=2714943 RepID=A0A6G7YLY8_9SPHN|nr:V-type ATPase 116kDa subunit family protein [Sphingomonas piscis]QIK77765.1 V-type ATPase 116kDa subunit family protein [Sphingomonas piscis]